MNRTAALALDDQILAVLRDTGGFPLSTAEIIQAVGLTEPCPKVWRRLHGLAVAKRVERMRLPGWRQVWWWRPPEQAEPSAGDGR